MWYYGNCGGPKRNVSDPVVNARVEELCIRLPESGVKITNEITWQPQRGAIPVLEKTNGAECSLPLARHKRRPTPRVKCGGASTSSARKILEITEN